jgi:hypothetical protein
VPAGVDYSLQAPPVSEEPPPEEDAPPPGSRSRWPDVLGLLWVVVAACVPLLPALIHGPYIGPFDFLSKSGLTARPGVLIHNSAVGDINDEVVPWAQAAWMQVHQGHLPLWLHNEALGMPLAFNFGSAAFSLPALVSYIFPIGAVLWVQILVSLIVGGTGAYFFARLLGLHPVACAFAGTTWVLSGPFFGYLGLPDTSVMSWAGWQFAAVLLIARGTHRVWSVALLAATIALSIYGGNPQIELVILIPLAVFAAALLVSRRVVPGRKGIPSKGGPIRQPLVDMVLGLVAGGVLAAPLALPGLQLANASVRTLSGYGSADPPSQVMATIFQSFWGQPFPGSFVNGQGFFAEQWVYVGAIAVVLSVVAVFARWRRPEVIGLAVGGLVSLVASIWQPLDDLLSKLPLIGHTWWSRSLIPLAFCLAMLAGIGLDVLVRGPERRRAARVALRAFGAIALLMGLVWLFGRGHLPAYAADAREKSFVWPAVATAIGLAVFGTMMLIYRRSRGERLRGRTLWAMTFGVALALLASQTVLLYVADEAVPSSSPTEYPSNPALTALQRTVGSSLVGLGNNSGQLGGLGLGLPPNTNVPYGIDEFAEYDPIAPATFFTTWYGYNHSYAGVQFVYDFVPSITTSTVARRYGISYVLVGHGDPGPTGAVFVRHIGNEDLYRVPGAATATLVPASPSGWPATDAPGKAVPVVWPGPSQVRIRTSASSPQVLRLRVSSVPGWHATIDGQPLAVTPYLSMMMQAHIPPGHHVIEFQYWPKRFSDGLILAGCVLLAFVVVALVVVARRRDLFTRMKRDPRH